MITAQTWSPQFDKGHPAISVLEYTFYRKIHNGLSLHIKSEIWQLNNVSWEGDDIKSDDVDETIYKNLDNQNHDSNIKMSPINGKLTRINVDTFFFN